MSVFCLLCLVAELPGAPDIDPGRSWYTLETEHFAVHFSSRGRLAPEQETLAAHVAELAEEVHVRLTGLVGWTPAPRTQIVVADFYDYANGWAAPLPDNTITILPFPPAGERTNFDDWLRTLLVHEYAHVVQMDMVKGLPAALRKVFGRVILTNPFVPVWLLEGYALQAETRLCGFGRARSAEYDMMVRAAADAGALLPIDRCCNYELETWPGGNAPYLYGGLFCRHLAEKPGLAVWDRFSLARSAGLPFFDNLFARRIFGAGFDRLWQEWQVAATRHADSVGRAVRREPVTQVRRLTDEGFHAGSPLWSRTGAEVYYLSRTGREYPAIKAVDTASRATRVLHRGRVAGNMSLSPDGRWLAFAEFERTDYADLSDIFCLNLYSGEVKRLTRGMRGRDPDFSPDGSSLVFVSVGNGRSDVMLLDLASGDIENLTETGDYTVYSGPRFSPDGRYVAVAVSHPGGFSDIEILDRSTGWIVPVAEDLALDISPSWSRTGRHLFFVSDRSGVFNLYAWSPETQEIRRCTNVPYGAFEPAVSPANRKLALVSHSAQGDDIAITALDARTWQPVPAFLDTARAFPDGDMTQFRSGNWDRVPSPADSSPVSGHSSLPRTLYYYNPFPTILPKLWLPLVWRDSSWYFGAFTFGWDALRLHQYVAAAGYRTGAGPFVALDYQLNRFRPLARLNLNADPRLQAGEISLGLPFLSSRRSSRLDLLARARHDTLLSARYGLAFATSNALAYRFDVAPKEGAVWGGYTELESRGMLGVRDRTRVLAYLSGFLGPPAAPFAAPPAPFSNWSLRLRVGAGSAFGDASKDSAWQTYPSDGILGVRGPSADPVPGRNVVAAGAQLSLPLSWPERGISTAPLFLRNLSAALFVDWGMVWNEWGPRSADWRESGLGLGAELRADLVVVHLLPASVAVGYSRGLRPEAANRFYVSLGSPLLGELLSRGSDRFDPAFLRN